MSYLNDPIFKMRNFYSDDISFTWRKLPKEMLRVDPNVGSFEVGNLAKDIVGWITNKNASCTICMMHEPAEETMQSLYIEWRRNPTQKVCLVAGEISLMHRLIDFLKEDDYLVFCCTTERISKEEILPDGSTKKTSLFKHVRLRRL